MKYIRHNKNSTLPGVDSVTLIPASSLVFSCPHRAKEGIGGLYSDGKSCE
jgi:hypothetical protein